MKQRLLHLGRFLLAAGLFVVTWLLLSVPLWYLLEKQWIRPIDGPAPDWFPILVTWLRPDGNYDCTVVRQSGLQGLIGNHPSYSFRVPPGLRNRTNEILTRQMVESHNEYSSRRPMKEPDGFVEYVVIEGESSTRQTLKVWEPTWRDSRNVGWYEASDKEIYPKKTMYYGPGFAMVIAVSSLFINIVIWGIGRWAKERLRKASRRA